VHRRQMSRSRIQARRLQSYIRGRTYSPGILGPIVEVPDRPTISLREPNRCSERQRRAVLSFERRGTRLEAKDHRAIATADSLPRAAVK